MSVPKLTPEQLGISPQAQADVLGEFLSLPAEEREGVIAGYDSAVAVVLSCVDAAERESGSSLVRGRALLKVLAGARGMIAAEGDA